jgi:prepilin-type N-terminal cleavage/methylation domain-containing protein
MYHLKKLNKRKACKTNAFTLIEVLVALMILSVAMVALTSSWSGSLFAYRKSEKVQLVNSLLKSKISELEIKYLDGPFDEIPEAEDGDYGDEFKDLKWSAQSQKLTFPDLSALMMAAGQTDETLLSTVQQMTEHFSNNIKELKVTLIWTVGENNLQFSATTYLVNYQNSLPIPGGG